MNKKIYALVATLILTLILGGCANSSKNDKMEGEQKIESLKMGLIPADDAEEMLRQYRTVTDYLSEKLGIPVEPQVTSDYTAAIEAMRAKHIDIAWFGPFSYILAHDKAGAEAIVNGEKENGKTTYKSVFIAKANSDIKSIEDFKGKSIAFVDPASTSGYLIPTKMLIENNIDPDTDFKSAVYAGTHNAVGLAVANGTVDIGANSDNSYSRMAEAGEINADDVVIVHESDPIPGSPIVVRGDLPEDLKQNIKQALLDMDEQTIHKVSGWGSISKYREVSDSDYDIIRETSKILNLEE